jgi:centromere protein C
VIEGAVNLRVHETSLILATGGMFMVPRGEPPKNTDRRIRTPLTLCSGNNYFIENIADREAKLFFTQARKIAASEDEQLVQGHPGAGSGSRRSSGPRTPGPAPHGRSSSVGASSPTVRVNGTTAKRAASTKI